MAQIFELSSVDLLTTKGVVTMKNAFMPLWAFNVAAMMAPVDLTSSYFGASSLVAGMINDYRDDSVNEFVGDFLEDNRRSDLPFSFAEAIKEPDCIVQSAAFEFFTALEYLSPESGEHIIRHAKMHFEPFGDYYIFALPWSNACANFYILRASNESEAINELITRFEPDFITDEEPVDYDGLYNDNGSPVNIDNLALIGAIKCTG